MTTSSTYYIDHVNDIRNENKENITIIWCDEKIGTLLSEHHIECRLRNINDYVRLFSSQTECTRYIESIKSEKIVLITSGTCATDFLPDVISLKQIDTIFIFCFKKREYEHLKNRFHKIVDIFVNFELLYEAIEKEIASIHEQFQEFVILNKYQRAARDLSSHCPELHWFQLARSVIMRLPCDESSKTEMLSVCRQYYRNNTRQLNQIEEFDRHYKPDDVIRWYTKQSFVYRLINKALRCEDFEQLHRFRFIVVELSTRLNIEHKEMLRSGEQTLIVYRGVKLSREELERFKRSIGQLIVTNGFWSTSRNRGRALLFSALRSQQRDVVPVVFEITCDINNTNRNVIFSDISKLSQHPKEEEVLFDISTCFQILSVQEDKNIWVIKLIIADNEESLAQDYFTEKSYEIENESLELMVGILLCEVGHYKQAEKHFEKMLINPKEEDISSIALNLGLVFYHQGDFIKARKYYDQVYMLVINAQPERKKILAAVLNNIGVLLQAEGDYEKAEENLQNALKIQKEIYPPNHPSITSSLTNIGNNLHERGKYDDALSYHRRALEIHKQFRTMNHPDSAASLNNIGNILFDQGKYNDALTSHKKALEIRQTLFPNEHPDIAISYNNIGITEHKQGKYQDALCSHQKAYEIRKACLPADHPKMADTLNNIGNVFQSQKKHQQAIDYYRKALIMREKCLPTIHSDKAYSFNNIGIILGKEKNYIEALESCIKAFEIHKKCRPLDHPDIAACFNNIGEILRSQGNYDEALNNFQDALEIRKKYLPKNHPDIADSLNNIGLIQQEKKNYIKSLELYEQSLALKKESLAFNHPSFASNYHNIAHILNLQGEYTKCLEYFKKAREILETYLSADDPDIAESLYQTGLVYEKLKQRESALDDLKRAREIYKAFPNEKARLNTIERHMERLNIT